MTEELLETIRRERCDKLHLCEELGKIINAQQDIIVSLQNKCRRLEKENWNLKQTKGRRK